MGSENQKSTRFMFLRSIDRYSPRYLFKEFAILDIGEFKWCLSGILPLIQFIMMDI